MAYASVVTPLGFLYDLGIKSHQFIRGVPVLRPQWISDRDGYVTEDGRIMKCSLVNCHRVRTVLNVEGDIRFKRVFTPGRDVLIGWTQDNKLVRITKENEVYTASVIVEDAIHVGDLTDPKILPLYSQSHGFLIYEYNEDVLQHQNHTIKGEVTGIRQGVIYTTEMMYAVYSCHDRNSINTSKICPIEIPPSATVIDAISLLYETIVITDQGMYHQCHRTDGSIATIINIVSWIKCVWKCVLNTTQFNVIDSKGDLYLLNINGSDVNFEYKFNIPMELLVDIRAKKSARSVKC